MEKNVQCPNCMQAVSADSSFCIYCGAKLPPVVDPDDSTPSISGVEKKKCKNGHEFDDPGLVFCPICGLPFSSPEEPARESTPASGVDGWTCACGHTNPADNLYCEACSKPKETRRKWTPSPAPKEEDDTSPLPDGMYTPTADDLVPRKWKK